MFRSAISSFEAVSQTHIDHVLRYLVSELISIEQFKGGGGSAHCALVQLTE